MFVPKFSLGALALSPVLRRVCSLLTWTSLPPTDLPSIPISFNGSLHSHQKVYPEQTAQHFQHACTLETAPVMIASIYVVPIVYTCLLPCHRTQILTRDFTCLPFRIISQKQMLVLLNVYIYSFDSSLPNAILIYPLNLCDHTLQ